MAKEGRIFRSETTRNFTVIKNEILDRADLSWGSKGLLAYLLRLPKEWTVYKSEVQKHALDGRHSFETAWNELALAGYILAGKQAKESGKFGGKDFVIFDVPQGITDAENQQRFVSEISNGTDAENQQLVNTKSSKKKSKDWEIPHSILEHFNFIRQKHGFRGKLLFTDQRVSALERLLKTFTIEDIKNVIRHRFEKWDSDVKMRDYLTPETLFRPSNFPKYLEEVNSLPDKDWTSKRTVNLDEPQNEQRAWPG